jgi:hypothetical protein
LSSTPTDAELVDRIYECSFVPELWPQVLRDTSKLSNSTGASLFVTNPDVIAWASSRNTQQIVERFAADGWYWRGQLMSRVHKSRHQGFLRDVDLCSQAELEQEPTYCGDWLKVDLRWGAATAFALPTGEMASMVFARTRERMADATTIQRLDQLRPHLARAAVMAARLHLERAQAASQTLAALGLAALVLDQSGKVLAANALVEGLANFVHWRSADRVTLKGTTMAASVRSRSGIRSRMR